jgi:hypothetical protein
METVANAYRIKVRKWCASCQHKEVENDGSRVCAKMLLKVPQNLVCQKWQLSDGLQNAGMSGGVIKKLTTIIIR